jgi:hypothetical protein
VPEHSLANLCAAFDGQQAQCKPPYLRLIAHAPCHMVALTMHQVHYYLGTTSPFAEAVYQIRCSNHSRTAVHAARPHWCVQHRRKPTPHADLAGERHVACACFQGACRCARPVCHVVQCVLTSALRSKGGRSTLICYILKKTVPACTTRAWGPAIIAAIAPHKHACHSSDSFLPALLCFYTHGCEHWQWMGVLHGNMHGQSRVARRGSHSRCRHVKQMNHNVTAGSRECSCSRAASAWSRCYYRWRVRACMHGMLAWCNALSDAWLLCSKLVWQACSLDKQMCR